MAEPRKNQVRGLDVAMNESSLVDRLQAQRGLADDLASVGGGKRAVAAYDFAQFQPSAYSITSTVVPSISRASSAWMIFGWLTRPTAFISRSKRANAWDRWFAAWAKPSGRRSCPAASAGPCRRRHAPFAQLVEQLVLAEPAKGLDRRFHRRFDGLLDPGTDQSSRPVQKILAFRLLDIVVPEIVSATRQRWGGTIRAGV